jgi:hypothetical protein
MIKLIFEITRNNLFNKKSPKKDYKSYYEFHVKAS